MRDLEKASGVGRETIRFYIREGLLPEPDKPSRNSARYSDVHVARLKAIKRLQEERFLPLSVIRTLLEAEDGDRWLLPDMFPMLEATLAQRLAEAGPARVALSDLGLPDHQQDHLAELMITVAEDGTVSGRDAAILRTVQKLDDIGFTPELGFHGGQMRLYNVLIDWLTQQEIRHFLEHIAGHVGEAKALEMAEQGIAIINELLGQLRTRALLRKLADLRQTSQS
ncbi:MerR family transcriptional regulator [Sandarakinorhabdus rubra]|uniref:MerR family transcriptional regulator n=1 Tax=Sandarakinorhabdus rubra TaxID=2672568 RepID=UPI0013DD0988|nr:MerR family transcriptional regulator [Sandarakinorhabdus rubra]